MLAQGKHFAFPRCLPKSRISCSFTLLAQGCTLLLLWCLPTLLSLGKSTFLLHSTSQASTLLFLVLIWDRALFLSLVLIWWNNILFSWCLLRQQALLHSIMLTWGQALLILQYSPQIEHFHSPKASILLFDIAHLGARTFLFYKGCRSREFHASNTRSKSAHNVDKHCGKEGAHHLGKLKGLRLYSIATWESTKER